MKEVVVLRIRLQSHQVHLTVLQAYTCIQYIDKNESKHSEMGPIQFKRLKFFVRLKFVLFLCSEKIVCFIPIFWRQTVTNPLFPSTLANWRRHSTYRYTCRMNECRLNVFCAGWKLRKWNETKPTQAALFTANSSVCLKYRVSNTVTPTVFHYYFHNH